MTLVPEAIQWIKTINEGCIFNVNLVSGLNSCDSRCIGDIDIMQAFQILYQTKDCPNSETFGLVIENHFCLLVIPCSARLKRHKWRVKCFVRHFLFDLTSLYFKQQIMTTRLRHSFIFKTIDPLVRHIIRP